MFARRFLRVLLSLLVGLITLAAIGAALNPVARAATTTVNVPAQSARSIPAPVNTGSTCVTLRRGTLGSVTDAYISAASPGANGGNSEYLHTGSGGGGEKRSLLRFDLSVIPAGAALDSANLYVYLTSKSDQTVRAHVITATWSETGVTWSNFGNSFVPETAGSFASDDSGFRSIAVTASVQAWLSGAPNYGLLLEETPSDSTTYKSSEHSASAYRPRLEICYHPVTPPTVRVYPDASPCNTTLQACINASSAGDVIQIKPGTYTTSLTLDRPVSLIGLGTITPTTLIAPLNSRVLTVTGAAITASTVISNLRITGGQSIGSDCASGACGGAILLTDSARPALNRLLIDNNSAYQGGGLWADAGPEVVIVDSKIISNSAQDNGGGIYVAGALNMTGGAILSNTAAYGGGGARVVMTATLNFGRWEGNTTGFYGGGLFAGNLIMTGTLFIDNEGNGFGGGAYIDGLGELKDGRFERNRVLGSGGGGGLYASSLRASGTHFIRNTANDSPAADGGGAYIGSNVASRSSTAYDSSAYSSNFADLNLVRLEDNATLGSGGGVRVGGPVTLTNSTLLNNRANTGSGGGVYAGGGLSIKDSRLENNVSRFNGGGGALTFGPATVADTVFVSNSALYGGGGLAALQGAEVQGSQFLRNTAESGGGLEVEGSLAVTNSVFISNTSVLGGGGVHQTESGDGRVVNSLFARNTASAAGGGALHFASGGQVDIIHTTIADPSQITPTVNPAAAIWNAAGSLNVTDTLIADHAVGIYNATGTAHEDYNLFVNVNVITDNVTSGGHNQYPAVSQFVDPSLDNYHLRFGAAAIDTGTPAGVVFDIDNQPRPIGPGFDIGFDEYVFSIQAEIDKTPPGGTVNIPPGVYTESLTLYKPVNLIGAGANQTIIHAAAADRVLTVTGAAITPTTVISGLTFSNGHPITIIPSRAFSTGYSASMGGGILITGLAAPTLIGVQVRDNRAVMGGGLYIDTGGATLIDSQVISNAAEQSGGGVYLNDGRVNLLGGAVSNNRADNGAGVYVDAGETRLQGTALITGNIASGYGGGVYLSSPDAKLTQLGGSIQSNTAPDGGGVKVSEGEYVLWAGQVFQNAATGSGGGVLLYFAEARFTQYGGSIAGNTAGWGGGLFIQAGRATLINGYIISNTADLRGGGVEVDVAGQLYMTGQSRIAGNEARGGSGIYNAADLSGGGGVYVQPGGQAVFVGGRVESNKTQGVGGGLYTQSGLTISGTRFLDNTARDGYAIYHAGAGNSRIVNALIADNHGPAANWNGASLSLNSTGQTQLVFSTLANSANASGRAIDVKGGGLSFANSIVASYSVGISRTAGTVIEDYNLFFGNGISLTGAITPGVHTRSGLDPQFVDPTVDDYHIRQTSPAINKALNVGVTRDFDFDARPIGGGFDIGADETQGAGATIPPGVITTTVLSYTAPNGGVTTAFIPPGAVSGTVTDTVSFYYTVINTDSITTPLPSHLVLSGDSFELEAFIGDEFTATQVITFNAPVTITIHYAEADLNGISEQTLKLYRLEKPPFGNDWCAIGVCRPTESQTLDTVNNIITATVTGFSRFGSMGAQFGFDLFLPIVVKNG